MHEVFYLPGEEMFLTFKTANGSGWLTSHRLILCKHPPGQLEGHTPEDYWLKHFEEAAIKDSTLILKFQHKKVKIQLPQHIPSLLEDIKAYTEKAAKNWKKQDGS
ncbi:MAG: hypothetical protein ACQCN3_12510 [Candidatus Bathyarchaeia archaeon]|jgi:hypothetical protein